MAEDNECEACWLDEDGKRVWVVCGMTGVCDENGCERSGPCPNCGRGDKGGD